MVMCKLVILIALKTPKIWSLCIRIPQVQLNRPFFQRKIFLLVRCIVSKKLKKLKCIAFVTPFTRLNLEPQIFIYMPSTCFVTQFPECFLYTFEKPSAVIFLDIFVVLSKKTTIWDFLVAFFLSLLASFEGCACTHYSKSHCVRRTHVTYLLYQSFTSYL